MILKNIIPIRDAQSAMAIVATNTNAHKDASLSCAFGAEKLFMNEYIFIL